MMKNFVRYGVGVALSAVLSTSALAAAQDFNFKDPKGVNTVYFLCDSEVEPIMGIASGISGTVSFDAENPKATKGKIVVDASSLHTENKGMNDALLGPDWIDVKTNPEISFTFKEVKESKKTGDDQFELTVSGDFACKGKTKELTTTVRASYLKDKLGNRMRGKKGDLLVLRSEFKIARKDFDIKPDAPAAVVSEDIQLKVQIVGYIEKN